VVERGPGDRIAGTIGREIGIDGGAGLISSTLAR
jgi:hypothetical protein